MMYKRLVPAGKNNNSMSFHVMGQDEVSAHPITFVVASSLWIRSEEVPRYLQCRPIGGRGITIRNQVLSVVTLIDTSLKLYVLGVLHNAA